MSSLVYSIFAAKNLAISIATYFKLVESVDHKLEKIISKEYNSAVLLLEQAKYISNPNVYSSILINSIDRFNQALNLEKRERLLLSHLGLMVCYFYLGETNTILHIQKLVSQCSFQSTFWEKYGDQIEEGGTMLLGAAMMFAGGGSAGAGAAAAVGGQTGAKLGAEHRAELKYRENRFNELRDAIVNIRFIQN